MYATFAHQTPDFRDNNDNDRRGTDAVKIFLPESFGCGRRFQFNDRCSRFHRRHRCGRDFFTRLDSQQQLLEGLYQRCRSGKWKLDVHPRCNRCWESRVCKPSWRRTNLHRPMGRIRGYQLCAEFNVNHNSRNLTAWPHGTRTTQIEKGAFCRCARLPSLASIGLA